MENIKRGHEPGNSTNIYCLMVDPDIQEASLNIRTKITSGSLVWVIRDPQGFVRGEGSAIPDKEIDERYVYDHPNPGNWRLEFKLQEASGEYSARWIFQWNHNSEIEGETYVQKYIGPPRRIEAS